MQFTQQILCLKKDDDESNNLFKIVPPHQEKGWGESVSYFAMHYVNIIYYNS